MLALSFAATSVLVKPESFQPSVIHPDPDKAVSGGPGPLLLGAQTLSSWEPLSLPLPMLCSPEAAEVGFWGFLEFISHVRLLVCVPRNHEVFPSHLLCCALASHAGAWILG